VEWAKQVKDGRYLFSGGMNHRAAECAVGNKTQQYWNGNEVYRDGDRFQGIGKRLGQ
jgi:hypothetical protein